MEDWIKWLELHGWSEVYGMNPDLLSRALEAAYMRALPFSGPTFPKAAFGQTVYNVLHHRLTLELLALPESWRVEDNNNFLTFAAPEDQLFVYPCAASGRVARPCDIGPRPSNPRGPAFEDAVNLNGPNGELFPEFAVGIDSAGSPRLVALLHQFDFENSTIYAEIATPVRRGGRLFFEDRFFLEPITFNAPFPPSSPGSDNQSDYDDDFEIGNG